MTIPEPTTTYEDLNTQSQQSDQMQRQIRPGPIQISLLIDSSCSTLQTVLIKATNEAFYNIVWDPQNLATKEGFDMCKYHGSLVNPSTEARQIWR